MAHKHNNTQPPTTLENGEDATTQLSKDALSALLREEQAPTTSPPANAVSGSGYSPTDEFYLEPHLRSVIASEAFYKQAQEATAEVSLDAIHAAHNYTPPTPGEDTTEAIELPVAMQNIAAAPQPSQQKTLRHLILGLSLMLLASCALLLWVLLY